MHFYNGKLCDPMRGGIVQLQPCLNVTVSLSGLHKSRFLPLHVTVADKTPFGIQADVTLKTNFFATRDMCNEFLPIIKPGGETDLPMQWQNLK